MMKKKQTHEFAFFIKTLPEPNQETTLQDQQLVHRITHVVRLTVGDTVVLFNQQKHVRLTIAVITKKTITGAAGPFIKNTLYQPSITLLLPVLKRDALDSAVYGAVECGVSKIQLITTQKVQRKWGGQKELERLQRIVIAAAEQSKCFSFAAIQEPITLETAIANLNGATLLFADPAGKPLQPITEPCAVLIGPEGDLNDTEKEMVKSAGAQLFKLTPTILRATQAAVLAVGKIRSF